MANPGFNIKVRGVENGYTIHVTRISGNPGEDERHLDYIAERSELRTKLEEIVGIEVNKLKDQE